MKSSTSTFYIIKTAIKYDNLFVLKCILEKCILEKCISDKCISDKCISEKCILEKADFGLYLSEFIYFASSMGLSPWKSLCYPYLLKLYDRINSSFYTFLLCMKSCMKSYPKDILMLIQKYHGKQLQPLNITTVNSQFIKKRDLMTIIIKYSKDKNISIDYSANHDSLPILFFLLFKNYDYETIKYYMDLGCYLERKKGGMLRYLEYLSNTVDKKIMDLVLKK